MSDTRLLRLAAADAGFFLLALHARAEALMRSTLGGQVDRNTTFREVVDRYFAGREGRPVPVGRIYFNKWRLIDEHDVSNQVRHRFAELSDEVAKAAASTFWDFLGFTGDRGRSEFRELPKLFDDWSKNPWALIASPELASLQSTVRELELRSQTQLSLYDQLKSREALAAKYEAELQLAKDEAQQLKARLKDKDAAYDRKRSEIRDLETTIRENSQALAEMKDLRGYLDALVQLTSLTRTRRAFEEQVLRLTPEQAALADQLPLDRETLIRGGAGTGKSLVLLKLVQRILKPQQGDLDFEKTPPTVQVLTYTRALTKYGTYLTGLLGVNLDTVTVKTADAVLVDMARSVLNVYVDFQWTRFHTVKDLIPASGLKENEFQAECDQLIWGWNLTWEEYASFERNGFKKPLNEAQRQAVWSTQEAVLIAMEGIRNMPAAIAARRLLERRNEWPERQVDYILLDEAQDIQPVRLQFFRALARRGFILAADEGQNLNQSRSPFKRAGLDFQGRSRILKTNFRNTVATEKVAAHFYDGQAPQGAFRHGPAPEWFFASRSEALLDQLVAKIRILLGELHYEPENVLIIHAGTRTGLEARLALEELPFKDVKDDDFSFQTEGQLRLSTFPSAKGLDSPVVLILWNQVYPFSGWSQEATDRQHRNFMYVALTRALEQVNVFVRDDESAVVATMKSVAGM